MKNKCKCIISGYAQTTNFCNIHKNMSINKDIKYPPKIKKLGYCNDCGKILFGITKKVLDYQKKHMDNEYVRVSCDECIAKGHTLTDKELGLVKTEKQIIN